MAPAELEAVLLTHPEVADAAVIGVYSDAEATELPRGYIVPKAPLGAFADESALRELGQRIAKWVATQVASHKRLRGGCYVIQAIPKS